MSSLLNSLRRLSGGSQSQMSTPDQFVMVQDTTVEAAAVGATTARIDSSEPTITLSVTPSQAEIGLSSPTKMAHYVATLRAAQMQDEEKRAPIDVMVSLDVSGSMSGSKLNLCKETCEMLINELRSDDRCGICTFSSKTTMVFPLSPLTPVNKIHLLNAVKRLSSGGSTNLSGGLTMAVQDILGAEKPAEVRAVMLLTDGHANSGVIEQGAICNLLKGCLGATSNVSVNVFGYGDDHNAGLLKALTEVSPTSGSYYFVESKDNVSSAFGDCLGGLMSVAAQNVSIEIRGQNIKPLHRRAVEKEAGRHYSVTLGDMFADETKDIVVESTLGDSLDSLEVQLKYVDIATSSFVTGDTVVSSIQRPSGSNESPISPHVLVHVIRMEVLEAIERANELGKNREISKAREVVTNMISRINDKKDQITTTDEQQMLITSFLTDLNDALSGLRDYNEYERYGSKCMASKMQTHMNQRSNAVHEDEMNCYRGVSKSSMARKMKMGSLSLVHK